MTITLERLTEATADARALIEELDADLRGPYAPDQHHGFSIDRVFASGLTFFIAKLNGEAVGCGGVAFDEGYAELKRMYVRPRARGRGVAQAVIAKLEADGDIVILIDTRTEAGTKALFGGTNPAAVVYARNDFIEKNPETSQKVTNAFVKSLKWLASAKPEDVAASVPEDFYLGDKDLYIRAVKNSLESYSRTGVIGADGMKSVYDMVKALDPEMASAQVDLSKTFVDKFVKKATGQS